MVAHIDPATLKAWLHDGTEIALIDVREHGVYGEAHLFYSVNVPYSRLEFEALRLVPRLSTRIVLVADEDVTADAAAAALARCGYDKLHVLAGGTATWQAQGYTLFAGVNLPSKTFGELAEHAYQTPRISADELKRRLDACEKLVVVSLLRCAAPMVNWPCVPPTWCRTRPRQLSSTAPVARAASSARKH